MNPRRSSSAWKLIGIVAILATMLGGAFIGYQRAGHSSANADELLKEARESKDGKKAGGEGPALIPASSGRGMSSIMLDGMAASANDERSIADILRRGDKAALNRLLPLGIREIEGSGGNGLSRQVKSHGVWFPVFDLSQAKKTAPGAPTNDAPADDENVDPDKVKLNRVPLSILAPPPSAGLVGQVISMSFNAVGGTPPYIWSMQTSGEAPGFAINPVTGIVAGVTSEPVNATFVIAVHDSVNAQDSIVAALTVTPAKKLTITTIELPDAFINKAFTATLSATGGVPPLVWTISNAPSGWACDADGGISATPTQPIEFDLDATVTDSQGTTAQQSIHATVTEGVKISTESPLMPAAPNENYVQRFEAAGGAEPYKWRISGGALPPGWRLDAEGLLTGVAGTQEQTFHFTVEARDSSGLIQRKDFELAMRRLLLAIPSRDKAGLAWQPQEVARAANAALAGVSVQRDGVEVYRGTGTNTVDYELTIGGVYRYTLNAHTLDGRVVPVSAALVRVLPMSLQRGVAGVIADPFADKVRLFQPLTPGGYGAAFAPMNVTGPPDGHNTFFPAWQANEMLSLHASTRGGGSIVMEFTDNIIADEPGPDFTVFENVPFVNRDPNNRYMEPAIVEVALFDGQWYRFPSRVSPPADGTINFRQPAYYAAGFAGVNATTGDDPTDPARSGGDSFDLAALGVPDLHWIRFVRIRSTGDGVMTDTTGTIIRHTSENNALSGKDSSGFDLDAVSAAHY